MPRREDHEVNKDMWGIGRRKQNIAMDNVVGL